VGVGVELGLALMEGLGKGVGVAVGKGVHEPPGGLMLANRQIQMTCAKNSGVCLGDEIKLRVVP
jgi:hypothetical protein